MAPVKDATEKAPRDVSRFAMPKACITYDKMGRIIYGLTDTPHRGLIGHHFERVKDQLNMVAEQRVLRPQTGRRGAAREALEKEWARREHAAQHRHVRDVADFYLRTSADNPLAAGRIPVAVTTRPRTASTSLRVYNEGELPYTLRTHVGPNMAATMVEDAEGEQRVARQRSERDKDMFDKVAAAKVFARRTCQEHPHGLTKLAISKLVAEDSGLMQMADVTSLRYMSEPETAKGRMNPVVRG
ncbi:hypothetical protein PLESTB_001454500 [Pleodorina starrii]|uniref:Uncharacterized protein n=1 Tax=Pleodorina starrii TaxID=330485 RepID=A0A9W6BVB8_9CHLO|nr:hypothetical protein PLESTB_001454500 [Pleodorina starrii]GLC65007.1 hypothetical protein PLESTF_000235500 [Pleodorina starrii]